MKACCAWVGVLFLAATALAQQLPYEQTQAGMNEQARKSLATAEKELARVLDELEHRERDHGAALAKLHDAQAAWEKYRDAQLQALWPSPDQTGYGSVHPMCVADAKRALTEARIRELRAMVSPIEGDSCGALWAE